LPEAKSNAAITPLYGPWESYSPSQNDEPVRTAEAERRATLRIGDHNGGISSRRTLERRDLGLTRPP
jgi:hypothetical protein